MRYYFAPMEGLTDSVFRRVHHEFFPGLDAYYMPFISPTMHRCFTAREKRELPEADSVPFRAVPQIMTKVPEDFLWAAEQCAQRGYDEVNLNLGCPSGTVVAKGKGSGMLADPDGLDRFLNRIFSEVEIPVSVKTRIGMESGEEFPRLMEIYNRYPIKELTIHPRVRKQFYKGNVERDVFRWAAGVSKNPLCYNGDLRRVEDVKALEEEFPDVKAVMIGRGLIGNPGMFCQNVTAEKLMAYHDRLLESYIEEFGGARNAMFRMKENWYYMIQMFEGSEKLWKKLRKTTDVEEYKTITRQIFQTLTLAKALQGECT